MGTIFLFLFCDFFFGMKSNKENPRLPGIEQLLSQSGDAAELGTFPQQLSDD